MKITIEGSKEEVLDFLSRVADTDVMCADMPSPEIVLGALPKDDKGEEGGGL